MIALTVPETRRLVLALGEPDAQRGFRFGWSRWRRMHQEVAARCHAARHARTRSQAACGHVRLPTALARGALTDAEWERVRAALPPQRPRVGRPRHDHRTILSGILTVVGTDLSWREIPAAYGNGRRRTSAIACGVTKAAGHSLSRRSERERISDAVGPLMATRGYRERTALCYTPCGDEARPRLHPRPTRHCSVADSFYRRHAA